MDLESIVLSEVSHRKTNTVITYVWNLKNKQMRICKKTAADSQIQGTDQWSPVRRGKGGGQEKSRRLRDTNYYA